MTKRLRAIRIGIVIGSLWLAACGGGGSDGGGDPQGGDEPPDDAPVSAALSAMADCSALHDAIRADARRKIETQADEMRSHGWAYVQTASQPTPICTPTPLAMPTAAAGGGEPIDDVTDTNVQVPGVDEADVVETDGAHLYLLRNDGLDILNVVPPEATALVERVAIEGVPLSMFVADGRALVLSIVYDTGDLGGSQSCGGIGQPFPLGVTHVDAVGVPFTCQASFVKLTLLDVHASPARTVRELLVEGYVIGARRHGSRARVAVQRYTTAPVTLPDASAAVWSPSPPTSEAEFRARVDGWERDALAAIDASALADWLPAIRERRGGSLVDRPITCGNARMPAPAFAQDGQNVILGLDLASDDAPPEDTLLGGFASQLYANGDTLVLAATQWSFEPAAAGDGPRTALHVLTLPADSLATVYRGSGFVPGTLFSQLAVDVHGDVLRVATMVTADGGSGIATRVTTARVQDGALTILGATPDIAPGEQLFGARFLGDYAYLVTFRRIDPLFVVDLKDPAVPKVVGEVQLPGFSEYLHPLGDHGLLTVGRDADLFGQSRGVAVRTFDVGDPTAPRLTAEYLVAGEGWTPASSNHLAFTFDVGRGLLALPFNRGFDLSATASLLLIGVDSAGALEPRGEIQHTRPSIGPCEPPFETTICPTWDEMLRGLFIDGNVYSISTSEVQVHDLADLTTPLATVELP